MNEEQLKRLDDWDALCDWLEDRPYNASYDPHCRGAYLLTGLYSPHRTISVPDPDAPPWGIAGTMVTRMKDIPTPDLAKEKERARECRAIVAERRWLQLVYWSTGHGWRLRKDYRTLIAAERARLEETS